VSNNDDPFTILVEETEIAPPMVEDRVPRPRVITSWSSKTYPDADDHPTTHLVATTEHADYLTSPSVPTAKLYEHLVNMQIKLVVGMYRLCVDKVLEKNGINQRNRHAIISDVDMRFDTELDRT